MKKSLHERIATLEAKKARDQARLAAMKGKQKSVDRKLDTRRKVLVGAAVLVEMQREPKFAAYVRTMLGKALTRPHDLEVVADLLKPAAEGVAPASNANSPPPPVETTDKLPGLPLTPGPAGNVRMSTFPVTVREKATG